VTIEPPTTKDPRTFIVESIEMLLARQGDAPPPVTLDARLQDDLDLDSLELAELSVLLEDNLGRDPYTEGIVPNTIREIVAFYG
jgi:acyl carrier protein